MTELSSIHRLLAVCPSLIEQAAQDVSTKKAALDRARREAEKARAMATVNQQYAKNQTVLQALVDLDTGVDVAEGAVIDANTAYQIAVSKHERMKDNFDAAKKESNLLEAEMRSFSSQRHA